MLKKFCVSIYINYFNPVLKVITITLPIIAIVVKCVIIIPMALSKNDFHRNGQCKICALTN